jgi:hypothetical protein
MKLARTLFLALTLASVAISATGQVADDFATHYFDPPNIGDYVKKIDGLIAQGEEHVFASPADAKGKIPKCKSENGIVMAYTIYGSAEGTVHHFSISRPPYLATPFGLNILALFGDRAGLPFPPAIEISENRVFHAIWFFPKEKAKDERQAAVMRRVENRKEQDLDKIFGRAVKQAISVPKMSDRPPQPTRDDDPRGQAQTIGKE